MESRFDVEIYLDRRSRGKGGGKNVTPLGANMHLRQRGTVIERLIFKLDGRAYSRRGKIDFNQGGAAFERRVFNRDASDAGEIARYGDLDIRQ